MGHYLNCMQEQDYNQQQLQSTGNLTELSPIKSRNNNKMQKLAGGSRSNSQQRLKQQSLVFERVKQPNEYESCLDLNEDCSTEAGGNFKFN